MKVESTCTRPSAAIVFLTRKEAEAEVGIYEVWDCNGQDEGIYFVVDGCDPGNLVVHVVVKKDGGYLPGWLDASTYAFRYRRALKGTRISIDFTQE